MAEFLGKCLYFSAKYLSAWQRVRFFHRFKRIFWIKAFVVNIWFIRNKFGFAISHGRITRIFFFAFSTKPLMERLLAGPRLHSSAKSWNRLNFRRYSICVDRFSVTPPTLRFLEILDQHANLQHTVMGKTREKSPSGRNLGVNAPK